MSRASASDPDDAGPTAASTQVRWGDAESTTAEPQRRPRRILVIEDDVDLRDAMADALSSHGHEVITAPDGRRALHQMRFARPDIVVLDLMMPVMDGWQFRAELKRDPALAGVPVVVISGNDSAAAAAVDAELYLTKPLDASTLLEAIEDVLRAEDRRREPARIAQAERLASLGTLAAGMAHEINNPLTYVLLNLDCAARVLAAASGDPRIADAERLVRSAIEGAERIRNITRGIRSFSRADDARRTPVDVRSVLDESLRLVMHEIRHRARLTRMYRDVPLVLASDGRLGQVFINLLTNAVQSIPEEDAAGHEIRVSTSTDGAGNAVIEVTDTGQGIAPHLLGRIFEPFFTTKQIGDGTGLGLSISHGIVRSLGGEIRVSSEVGVGTRFRVVIPPFRTAASLASGSDVKTVEGPRRKLLVVDDDRGVCEALAAALSTDHEVITVQSSREALTLLDGTSDFDLVLCDVHMPELSGIGLYEQLRSDRPDLANRFAFMTAGTFTPRSRDFLASSDRPLLEKPLDLAAIRALLAG